MQTRPRCKKCLIEETDPEGLYREIQQRIALLDEDSRTEKEAYSARLDACMRCDKLTNGMCALCGCFVELRAAKKAQRCPESTDKWAGI